MVNRKILQDMVPSRKAEIKPTSKIVGKKVILEREDEAEEIPPSSPKPFKSPKVHNSRSRRHSHWLVFVILIVSVAVIAIAVSFVYAKAVVVVIPKTEKIQVKNIITACKDTPCVASNLAYQVVQIPTAELHQTVVATTGPYIQTNARGGIILYNNFSTTSQKIVSGTRLTNTSGLIYQTVKTVIVPGISKSKTGASTAGSVAVDVIAASPGSQYNIAPTDLTGDFKIVAYKGTAKYDTFYGRLNPKGSITGGYTGQKIIIAPSVLSQAYTDLKNNLAAKLIVQSKSLVPQGYIMYDNAYSIVYDPIVATSSDVGMRATFYGLMFKINDLVQAIASTSVPVLRIATEFPNQSFVTKGLQSLAFNISNASAFSTNNLASGTNTVPLIFSLSGSFTVFGTFPSSDIIKQLAGKDISNSQAIFSHYSAISSAHAIITPFWRHSFPNSPDKITIITQ